MLEPIGLFATPDCVEDLQDYVSKFKGPDAIIANTIMGMTWNLCAKLTERPANRDTTTMQYISQLAMYLDRGIEKCLGSKNGDFNEWFCDAGDLERTHKILEIAPDLYDAIPEDCPVPWSTICYIVLEEHLADWIYQQYQADDGSSNSKNIVTEFKKLMGEFISHENQQS